MSTFIDNTAHFTANPLRKITSSFKGVCAMCNFHYSPRILDENADLQPLREALKTLMNSLSCYAQNNTVLSSADTIMDIRLSSIEERLTLHSIQLNSFIPVVRSILSSEPDNEIWNNVVKLVDTYEPIHLFGMSVASTKQGEARHSRCTAPYEGTDQIMETL
ncbi:Bgt-51245 [Blumeria graminis f. sp. tritici]|uniref:Bgt-51245 n=1 Tax=Blumeria graminis f. sp. tritici TaxID=62690 RepID=A0A9X9PQC9_BLUGR|nr:Bgt-51245 [Blumeria graminis f. sp. tritici]